MQIQVNTDNNVHGSEHLIQWVERELDATLSRFSDRITRVEVHLSDDTAGQSDDTDKRCVLEARSAGQRPVAVTHHAASVDEACRGAADKLAHLLDSKYDRSDHRKGGQTIRTMAVDEELA
ncbi:HPF/RaiA family ribosome-associated protein [Lentzea sp. NPDC034063]|uniref:HPF/RaiA family ribosome-associated protein n=1 Tax=unclassified Lentzea TaxID=2643253 RepID=UPI0033D67406